MNPVSGYDSSPSTPDGLPLGAGLVGDPLGGPPELQRTHDFELVQETKNQIRTLVQEITALSQADMPVNEFYGEFLQRVALAMASIGGAIWIVDASGKLELAFQVNLSQTGVADGLLSESRHQLLLRRLLGDGQATLVAPQAGSSEPDEPGNPSDHLLVLAPLKVDEKIEGIVEIVQRPAGGAATQRGYLRFLIQMAEHASSFLRLHRLRELSEQQSLWKRIERFVRAAHRDLDSTRIAYTIANDGRELIECDRATILIRHGQRMVCAAVSGTETVERRSTEIQKLERLAETVAAAGQPIWAPTGKQLAPQIDTAISDFVDESNARLVGVLPMIAIGKRDVEGGELVRKPAGVLIVERYHDVRLDETFLARAELVAQHGASALGNALAHEELFLLPVWRAIGKSVLVERLRDYPKSIVLAAVASVALIAAAAVPVNFSLAARGTLRPSERHHVFAALDGVVKEIHVRHEQRVRSGDLLARLTNRELESELIKLEGDIRTNQEQLRALEREQTDSRLKPSDQTRTASEIVEHKQQHENLQQQLRLIQERQQQLNVLSPCTGEVVTWRVDELLMGRPIQRGQMLMLVINPEGDWELELFVPERTAGHLSKAWAASPGELPVSFQLTSYPEQTFRGKVIEVRHAAEADGDAGNSIAVRVSLDKSQLPELRSDISVAAKIECGRRPLGYVLLREVWETLQVKVLFWI